MDRTDPTRTLDRSLLPGCGSAFAVFAHLGVVVEMEKKTTIRRSNPCKHYVSGTYLTENYQRNDRLFQLAFDTQTVGIFAII